MVFYLCTSGLVFLYLITSVHSKSESKVFKLTILGGRRTYYLIFFYFCSTVFVDFLPLRDKDLYVLG